ncbi:MAG: type II toxin-antitoxin system HicB family antitoxin [Anaerovoracaceae bacterium]
MKLVYPAIFTPFGDEPGYTVDVPDLPDCVTEGSNLIEAIDMGVDAASGWILNEIEEGNEFPAASALSSLEVPNGSFSNLLVLDMNAYAEQYGNKAVRRNITIPAWLDTYVQKNNLSLSKVIQDSLLNIAQSHDHK